jgi:ribosomal protein S18 acetylase RimI-like enzyme
MEFSYALSDDYSELIALYRAAIARMNEQNIPQWDEIYPSAEVLQADVSSGQMQIGRLNGRIAVAFLLEECSEEDYEKAEWRYQDPRFIVLHRLCVYPAFQGQGVARQTMDFLEQAVLNRGLHAIRLDAFSLNPTALKLYESRGYEKAGEIRFRKGLFYLYEKRLMPNSAYCERSEVKL